MNYPHINVEETFDEVVREHGGAIVLREKISKSPDFDNVDYVFHFEKVIAELKCMMEDNVDSANNQAKINKVVEQYYAAGKIKTKTIDEITWPEFPREFHNEIYTITTTSIQARIKKANKQIRETKDKLGLNSYTGMLIIANDGLVSMPPAAFVHAINKYVMHNCREISYFIFLTANIFATVKGIPMPAVFWFGMEMEKAAKMDEKFINCLRNSWQGMVCRKTGVPGVSQDMNENEMESFWKARNLPKQN